MTLVTDNNKGIYPDATFVPGEVIPEALILNLGTPAGTVEGDAPVVRVPYVAEDPTTEYVAEAEEGTFSEPDLDELTISTKKLMTLSRSSREASLSNVSAQLLASSMGRSMIRKANASFINDTEPTRLGLANTEGITTLGHTGANLDMIIEAMTGIEVSGGQATDIVTDPLTWASLMKLKAGEGSNVPLIGNPGQVNERSLFNCAVHVSPDVAQGTLLVVDSNTVLTVTGQLETAISSDVYFTSDRIVRRLTWRIGWKVADPNKIVKITFDEPAA
jgi:HK97 family phage major capsid protein